ncbi:hypothetical protein B9P84_16650 [Citrobacter braakii]|uniref:hypothetical protein n=1 Tax=Citrobacter braakii TaxID=57706 RepID=UPI000B9B3BF0|nr:hypothetical protein [Citrobacter braakii]MCY9797096.1 hypothetical protein [Citrobacter braakii]MDL4385260.1 hypothetical protein [Citrobacter braakii]OXU10697.1 hypothetical protein B9P84_16650 [Citrobacter braakii]
MNWKLVGVIFLCFFMFLSGLLVGGVDLSWMKEGHESEVAFWTMLGGWVSGVATVAAVVVSMTVAYQASQAGVEKLEVSFDHIYATHTSKRLKRLTLNDVVNIKVKNLRSVTATILDVYLEIEGVRERLKITNLKHGGLPIPYSLHQIGEKWEFAFSLTRSSRLDMTLLNMKSEGEPSFRKGCFIIETAMKQYTLKMQSDLLAALKERYQLVVNEQDVSKLQSGWSQETKN